MGSKILGLLTLGVAAIMIVPASHAATFNDENYHEYILYNVDTSLVDVLIFPPASPYYLRDLETIRQSVDMWDSGVNAIGPGWLANGFELRHFTLGHDLVTPEALADPEIVVISAEYNPVLLFGVGAQANGFFPWCHGVGPGGSQYDVRDVDAVKANLHRHDGSMWGMFRTQCSDGGAMCFVVNTNFLWLPDENNAREMFDLNSHELGHCLGVGHVGDAGDFSARRYPATDIMSYEHGGHVHCVSSLNILAMQAVYGDLLGHPEYKLNGGFWSGPQQYVQQSPAQYEQDDCANPVTSILDYQAAVPDVEPPEAPDADAAKLVGNTRKRANGIMKALGVI